MKGLKNIFKFFISIFSLKSVSYSQDNNIYSGVRQINEGAKKLLNKNSEDYKEVVEKYRGAWKKLAEL